MSKKASHPAFYGDIFSDNISYTGTVIEPSVKKSHLFEMIGSIDATAWAKEFRKSCVTGEMSSLGEIPSGSGVYALYIKNSQMYKAISNTDIPIYVGKSSQHVNPMRSTQVKQGGCSLSSRLKFHQKNITKAENLDVNDVFYRYMTVDGHAEYTVEANLIDYYCPLWNLEIQGFGRHGDVARKEISDWDTLHPGRSWASSSENFNEIANRVDAYFMKLFTTNPNRWSLQMNSDYVKSITR